MPASDHPLGAELFAAADRVVCWANDLYSLNKEVQENDVHNLVLSLQAAHGLGLEEALARAAAMHDAQVERFLRARERVLALEGPERSALLEIADALQARMAGNSSWSERSIRYSASVTVRVDGPAAGDRAVTRS
jgi:Trk K+ transport system NAD-binding subunit